MYVSLCSQVSADIHIKKYIYIYMYNLKVFVKIRNIDFCERVIFRNPKGKFVVGKFCDGLISCIQQGSRKR